MSRFEITKKIQSLWVRSVRMIREKIKNLLAEIDVVTESESRHSRMRKESLRLRGRRVAAWWSCFKDIAWICIFTYILHTSTTTMLEHLRRKFLENFLWHIRISSTSPHMKEAPTILKEVYGNLQRAKSLQHILSTTKFQKSLLCAQEAIKVTSKGKFSLHSCRSFPGFSC